MPKLASSAKASTARVAELRKKGLRVRVIALPDGGWLVMSSPKLINPIRIDHVWSPISLGKWKPSGWTPMRAAKKKRKKKRRAKKRGRRT